MNNKSVTVYQYGTTIRFEAEFFDFEGAKIAPDTGTVKLKIYNQRYIEISDPGGYNGVAISAKDGEVSNKFQYDYVTEKKEQRLFYEWYAEIDGKPSLERGEFVTKFI